MRKRYPTDLSDAEWECIEPHLPTPRAAGKPRSHSLREILDAIFYMVTCRVGRFSEISMYRVPGSSAKRRSKKFVFTELLSLAAAHQRK
jgi:hypothetical protein